MPQHDPLDDLGLPRDHGSAGNTWIFTSPEFPGRWVQIIRPEGITERVFIYRYSVRARWVSNDMLDILAVAMDMLSE